MILLEAIFGCYDYGIHYKHIPERKWRKKKESCFSHTSSTFVFEVKNVVGAHWEDRGNGLLKDENYFASKDFLTKTNDRWIEEWFHEEENRSKIKISFWLSINTLLTHAIWFLL